MLDIDCDWGYAPKKGLLLAETPGGYSYREGYAGALYFHEGVLETDISYALGA